ncbi:MAG: hypothetical protein K8U57_27320 [Planctomycetes bacterium]|nr:hypothetical protein [Planctomycetota bacterium]
MRSQSLISDHAMALAKVILEMIAPCLREEEQKDAFKMIYEACAATLNSFEEKADRMHRRVKPSNN